VRAKAKKAPAKKTRKAAKPAKAKKRAKPKPARRAKRAVKIPPPPVEELMADGAPLFATPIERF
jgi:hypothetical protein